MNRKNIFHLSLAVALMVLPCLLQTHMKKAPQQIAIVFGVLVMTSLFTKMEGLKKALTYLLLGLIVFVNCNQLVYHFVRLAGIDMYWITDCAGCSSSYGGLMLGNWIGAFVAPLSVYLYHRKSSAGSSFPKVLAATYLIAIATIYLLFEVVHVHRLGN